MMDPGAKPVLTALSHQSVAPGIHRNHGKALAFHRLEIQIKSVKFSMEQGGCDQEKAG